MFGLSFLSVKMIVIGVLILSALAYVGFLHLEIKHYKDAANKWEVTYNTYKNSEEGMQAALKSSNSALTLQAKQELIARLAADEQKNQAIKQRIANDQAAKSIAIPAESIRVLNDSASIGRNPTGSTPTVSGDASSTSTTATSDEVFTLQDIEGTAEVNNANHWNCIRVVEAWQVFWKTFADNVGKAAGNGSP